MNVIQALKTIPDPRSRRGRQYPLFGLLAIELLAAMHGERSLRGMWLWARARQDDLLTHPALGLRAVRRIPSLATFWYAVRTTPAGARLLGDKAYNSAADEASILAETGVRLVPVRRANMRPLAWFMDAIELRAYRHTIETVNSQLEKMGIERLYARTNAGFELKVHATLIALICTNMN